ncbi:hypothetical protein [Streptococcus suis]|uniref:hypothetical protein n=1 Tax=Streptococcus suis TaxID=1307 RepID=UPI00046264BA|nr:hypothetical protein [Streptococcus suis]
MKVIKLPIYYKNNKKTKECRLSLIDNEELCVIEISLGSQSVKYEAESFFQALIALRLDLENDGGIIQCNGSDRQIFPSPLQMAMGGEKAYLLEIGKQASV